MTSPQRHSSNKPDSILNDPGFLPVRLDLNRGLLHFALACDATYRQSRFLVPGRLINASPKSVPLPISDLLEELRHAQPFPDIHFVAHPAFASSTLLSQVLERRFHCAALREPYVLDSYRAQTHRSTPSHSDPGDRVCALLLSLLARPICANEPNVVKLSDACDVLLWRLLSLRPQGRALFIAPRLPEFLAASLKRRQWTRARTHELQGHLAVANDVSTDAQRALLLWHRSMTQFVRLHYGATSNRVALLDTDRFLETPDAQTKAAGAFLRLSERSAPDNLGTVLTQHAKTARPFDINHRRHELDGIINANEREISDALNWGRATTDVAELERLHQHEAL